MVYYPPPPPKVGIVKRKGREEGGYVVPHTFSSKRGRGNLQTERGEVEPLVFDRIFILFCHNRKGEGKGTPRLCSRGESCVGRGKGWTSSGRAWDAGKIIKRREIGGGGLINFWGERSNCSLPKFGGKVSWGKKKPWGRVFEGVGS